MSRRAASIAGRSTEPRQEAAGECETCPHAADPERRSALTPENMQEILDSPDAVELLRNSRIGAV